MRCSGLPQSKQLLRSQVSRIAQLRKMFSCHYLRLEDVGMVVQLPTTGDSDSCESPPSIWVGRFWDISMLGRLVIVILRTLIYPPSPELRKVPDLQ
jgi:hypothetical protein